MKVFMIFCVYFGVSVNGQDFANLGAAIEQNVRRNLEQLDGLGDRFRQNFFPFDNLGTQIQQEVRAGLSGLENLGPRIQAEVAENLKPVEAMAIRLHMINGIGGKTVVSFPSGKTLITKNGDMFECSGSVNNQGECGGSEIPLDFNKTENYCYVTPNVRVNNYMCFSSNSQGISANVINGKVSCSTVDNKPYLLISDEDYQKMCSGVGGKPTYTYYVDVNSPVGFKIPTDNPYLKCQGNTPNVCVFN